jgi:hypothetical protein
MSLYLTPSFVRLPLSNSIIDIEIGKLVGIFIVAYLARYVLTVYTLRGI